jgi:hypothetical protein
MHEVVLDGKLKLVAATWDELAPAQLQRLMPVLYGPYTSPLQQRFEALQLLLGISRAYFLRITDVMLVQIKWLTDFLFEEDLAFTRQLLPALSRKWYLLRGPLPRARGRLVG